jgi:hypothetical protein
MNYRKGHGAVECSGFYKPEKACKHVINRLFILIKQYKADYEYLFDSKELESYLTSLKNPTIEMTNCAIKKYEESIGKARKDLVMHELRECELVQTVE